VEQCASYDIVGRVQADYQLDPRSKLNSTITAEDDDTLSLLPEARANSTARRRRQSFLQKHGKSISRQTIVGDDSITVVSSDAPSSIPVGGGSVPVAGGSLPVADDAITVISSDSESPSSIPVGGGSVPSADVASPGAAGVSFITFSKSLNSNLLTSFKSTIFIFPP